MVFQLQLIFAVWTCYAITRNHVNASPAIRKARFRPKQRDATGSIRIRRWKYERCLEGLTLSNAGHATTAQRRRAERFRAIFWVKTNRRFTSRALARLSVAGPAFDKVSEPYKFRVISPANACWCFPSCFILYLMFSGSHFSIIGPFVICSFKFTIVCKCSQLLKLVNTRLSLLTTVSTTSQGVPR